MELLGRNDPHLVGAILGGRADVRPFGPCYGDSRNVGKLGHASPPLHEEAHDP